MIDRGRISSSVEDEKRAVLEKGWEEEEEGGEEKEDEEKVDEERVGFSKDKLPLHR